MTPDEASSPSDIFKSVWLLMFAGVGKVLAGEELDPEPWQAAARQIEVILPGLEAMLGAPVPPGLRALGELAQAVVAPDLATAVAHAGKIPEAPDFDLPRVLGKAVVTGRLVRGEGADRPEVWADLATSVYALLPFVQGPEQAQQAIRKTAEANRAAVAGFAQRGDWDKAASPASIFVAMANELTTHFKVFDYLDDALTWAERLTVALPEPQGDTAFHMCAVATNALNTCGRLASTASSPEIYLEKQAELARYGVTICQRLGTSPGTKGAVLLRPHESLLRGLVISQVNLAHSRPGAFDRHAGAAWSAYLELRNFASSQDDPDTRQRCEELGRQLTERFREKVPGWVPPGSSTSASERPGLEELIRVGEQAQALAKRIRELADPEERRRELEDTIEAAYVKIEAALVTVMGELGLNHHVCRLFAMLGALAGGRLSLLARQAITPWTLYTEDLERTPPGFRRQIRYRQLIPAFDHFQEEIEAIGGIQEIAELATVPEADLEWQAELQALLRRHNARLLAALLPQIAQVQYSDHRRIAAASDVTSLLRIVPDEHRPAAEREYAESVRPLSEGPA